MRRILLSLGFGLEGDTILVPSWRSDVEHYSDIAEEVARFYGYNKIPDTLSSGLNQRRGFSPEQKAARAEEMLALNNGGYVNYIDYFLSLFERWNWHDAPEVGDIYREFQFRFPEYSTLVPDAVDTLKALRNKGYLLGIITNGPSVLQNRKLDVCALRPLVDLCVVSGDENLHKPDPEIFRRAASRMGVGCHNCVYVGDPPVNDIEGARRAGMRPIYINAFDGPLHPENVTEIHTLSELTEIF